LPRHIRIEINYFASAAATHSLGRGGPASLLNGSAPMCVF